MFCIVGECALNFRDDVVIRKRDGHLVLATEPIAKVPAELRALLGDDKPTGEAATGTKTPVAAGDD